MKGWHPPRLGLLLFLILFLAGTASAGGGLPGISLDPPAYPVAPEEQQGLDLPSVNWAAGWVERTKIFRQMEDRSLALDPNGHPHIAYGEEHLYYAWYDGSAWHVESVDSSAGVGRHAALGVDASGRPHISYYDATLGNLKYAHYDGAAWQVRVVDAGVGSC